MPRKVYHYTVKGIGEFPIDMLRYDAAHPESEADSIALVHTFHSREWKDFEIRLVGMIPPTIDRWSSFMWRVVPGSVQEY